MQSARTVSIRANTVMGRICITPWPRHFVVLHEDRRPGADGRSRHSCKLGRAPSPALCENRRALSIGHRTTTALGRRETQLDYFLGNRQAFLQSAKFSKA